MQPKAIAGEHTRLPCRSAAQVAATPASQAAPSVVQGSRHSRNPGARMRSTSTQRASSPQSLSRWQGLQV
jgi:hypothetical protein